MDLNNRTLSERNLYQNGRIYKHWQGRRQDYTEFKRIEKQRSWGKEIYNELAERHWLNEPPAEVERRIQQ